MSLSTDVFHVHSVSSTSKFQEQNIKFFMQINSTKLQTHTTFLKKYSGSDYG